MKDWIILLQIRSGNREILSLERNKYILSVLKVRILMNGDGDGNGLSLSVGTGLADWIIDLQIC